MEVKVPIGACVNARCQAPVLLEVTAELQREIARMQSALQTMRELLEGPRNPFAAKLRYWCDHGLGSVIADLVKRWKEAAKRDDVLDVMVPSDVRQLVAEIELSRANEWRPIKTAPKDGISILLLTSDFGAVEGCWDIDETNFYKSQEGWASYDPDNAQGEWVSHWQIGDGADRRLYCGSTPHYWAPLPAPIGVCEGCGQPPHWCHCDDGPRDSSVCETDGKAQK